MQQEEKVKKLMPVIFTFIIHFLLCDYLLLICKVPPSYKIEHLKRKVCGMHCSILQRTNKSHGYWSRRCVLPWWWRGHQRDMPLFQRGAASGFCFWFWKAAWFSSAVPSVTDCNTEAVHSPLINMRCCQDTLDKTCWWPHIINPLRLNRAFKNCKSDFDNQITRHFLSSKK